MNTAIGHLQTLFESKRNPEKAAAMSAYMKNRFPFFGIQKKERSVLQKDFLVDCRQLSIDELHAVAWELWSLPEREYQYAAMELLFNARKKWTAESLELFEKLILNKSWWDSVDFIAARMVGGYCMKEHLQHHDRLTAYSRHQDLWLKRTAIIHQLFYKEKTDKQLFDIVFENTRSNKDFFIQKAIGWALRQYAYTDPEHVLRFVDEKRLNGLARREALKHLG